MHHAVINIGVPHVVAGQLPMPHDDSGRIDTQCADRASTEAANVVQSTIKEIRSLDRVAADIDLIGFGPTDNVSKLVNRPRAAGRSAKGADLLREIPSNRYAC